jgi:hypothetical protein
MATLKHISNERMPSIWIIYPGEHRAAAMECHRQLKEWGFDCKMDVTDILPGQRWKREIIKNISAADAVLILLSQDCLTKEGIFQWELRYAVEKSREKPDDQIFLVPLRLERCELPDVLESLQWVDWFNIGDPLDAIVPTLGRIMFEMNRPWRRSWRTEDDNGSGAQGIPVERPRPTRPREPQSIRTVAEHEEEGELLALC